MKNVVWLGGPEDGKVFEVEDQVTQIKIAQRVYPLSTGDEPRPAPTDRDVEIPIIKLPDGRYAAAWPKGVS